MNTLADAFGRIATDLRVSVTDRCDFRCTYCMPEEGMQWLPREDVLTFDEIVRLVTLFQSLGVRTVRLTGGEPLMRPHLPDLVRALAEGALDDISLTTNGSTLQRHAIALKQAGLKRVTVSLDSLDQHQFIALTRRDRLDDVLAGITAAVDAGLQPVKVNCVVLKGKNDDELLRFAEFARNTPCDVRFIEYMPLDAGHAWTREDVLPGNDIVERINASYPLTEMPNGNRPAKTYAFADGANGSVGIIASVTEPFCGTCDRIRLSADGLLQTCLFATTSTDLRSPLRNGALDDEIRSLIITAVARKQSGHSVGSPLFIQPTRGMSLIGG